MRLSVQRVQGVLTAPPALKASTALPASTALSRSSALPSSASMHPIGARAVGVIDQSRTLEKQTEIVERNAAINVRERALDHLLELRSAERARSIEMQQASPRLRCEASLLVRSHYAKSHSEWRDVERIR